jgi:hypothetical protein
MDNDAAEKTNQTATPVLATENVASKGKKASEQKPAHRPRRNTLKKDPKVLKSDSEKEKTPSAEETVAKSEKPDAKHRRTSTPGRQADQHKGRSASRGRGIHNVSAVIRLKGRPYNAKNSAVQPAKEEPAVISSAPSSDSAAAAQLAPVDILDSAAIQKEFAKSVGRDREWKRLSTEARVFNFVIQLGGVRKDNTVYFLQTNTYRIKRVLNKDAPYAICGTSISSFSLDALSIKPSSGDASSAEKAPKAKSLGLKLREAKNLPGDQQTAVNLEDLLNTIAKESNEALTKFNDHQPIVKIHVHGKIVSARSKSRTSGQSSGIKKPTPSASDLVAAPTDASANPAKKALIAQENK